MVWNRILQDFALLAICSPVTEVSPQKVFVMRNFDVFFLLSLKIGRNSRLAGDLRRNEVVVM